MLFCQFTNHIILFDGKVTKKFRNLQVIYYFSSRGKGIAYNNVVYETSKLALNIKLIYSKHFLNNSYPFYYFSDTIAKNE